MYPNLMQTQIPSTEPFCFQNADARLSGCELAQIMPFKDSSDTIYRDHNAGRVENQYNQYYWPKAYVVKDSDAHDH